MDGRSLRRRERTAADLQARVRCSIVLACLLAPAFASAQTSHTSRSYPVTFATSGQSMWGPGTSPLSGFNSQIRLVDLKWDVGDTTGDIRSFDTFAGNLQFGGEIGAYSRGDFGIFSRFSDVGSGDVGVNYPVDIRLDIPDANTFRDGETITITSSFVLQPGAAINMVAPRGAIKIDGSAALAAGAHTKVCVFGCTGFPIFPTIDYGATNIPLLELGYDASSGDAYGQLFGLPKVTLPHTISFIESELTNMSGTIGLPRLKAVSAVNPDARSLRAAARDTFVDLAVDMDGFVIGIPLGFDSPNFHGAHLKYETVDISTVLKMMQDQSFSFTPTVHATLVFPRPVEWREEKPDGELVASGMSEVISFEVGNTLELVYPSGLKDPMTIAPTFWIRNTFTSSVINRFSEDIVLTIGEFELSLPQIEIFPSVTVDVCWGLTVDADLLDVIPDESCPATTPAVKTPVISIDIGPLLQQSLFGLSQELALFPSAGPNCTPGSSGCGRWELQGFNDAPGGAFMLDPENPIITVATSLVSGLSSGTGPAGTLTQTIGVTNAGDVPLSSAQIADLLSAAVITGGAFGVQSISSVELTENAGFNGVADANTLTRADVLAVGGSGTVTVAIDVQPGNIFTAMLEADGTSPIGTTVTANASASFGVFAFDIRPSMQNTTSKGVLPVMVFGSEGLDPAQIDLSTVRLEGVAPVRGDLVLNEDGIYDLALKFDRQALLAALQPRLDGLLAGAPAAAEALPGVDGARVARALLGETAVITADERRLADRNGNGLLDVGDLRALLVRPDAAVTTVLAEAESAPAGPKGATAGGGGAAGTPDNVTLTLVLTGMLSTGIPFMGEDALTISQTGSGQ